MCKCFIKPVKISYSILYQHEGKICNKPLKNKLCSVFICTKRITGIKKVAYRSYRWGEGPQTLGVIFCCDWQDHTAIFAVNRVAEYELKKDTRRGKCIV